MLEKLQPLHKPFLIFALLAAGITHFVAPGEFTPTIPPILPEPLFWVYGTGVLELIAVIGLLLPKWQKLTAYALMAYFIAILPAHFQMIINDGAIFGISGRGFFIARVFVQLIFIFSAWEARRSKVSSIFPVLDQIDEKLALRWSKPYGWHSKWLWIAAWYNLGFGYWVVIFPSQAFELFSMEVPPYLFIWQSVGMIVGVYGIGYGVAAFNEVKHWAIVLVGWLGKIFGPIGFVYTFMIGEIDLAFGTILIFNDLIWYPSFFGIMIRRLKSFTWSDVVG